MQDLLSRVRTGRKMRQPSGVLPPRAAVGQTAAPPEEPKTAPEDPTTQPLVSLTLDTTIEPRRLSATMPRRTGGPPPLFNAAPFSDGGSAKGSALSSPTASTGPTAVTAVENARPATRERRSPSSGGPGGFRSGVGGGAASVPPSLVRPSGPRGARPPVRAAPNNASSAAALDASTAHSDHSASSGASVGLFGATSDANALWVAPKPTKLGVGIAALGIVGGKPRERPKPRAEATPPAAAQVATPRHDPTKRPQSGDHGRPASAPRGANISGSSAVPTPLMKAILDKEEDLQYRKHLEVTLKKVAVLEATLQQTRNQLHAATDMAKKAQAKALTLSQKIKAEKGDDNDAGDDDGGLSGFATGGGGAAAAGVGGDDIAKHLAQWDADTAQRKATEELEQIATEVALVRRTLGSAESHFFRSAVEGRNFPELRKLFVGALHKLEAQASEVGTGGGGGGGRRVHVTVGQASNNNDGNQGDSGGGDTGDGGGGGGGGVRRTSTSRADGVVAMYKKQIEEVRRDAAIAKAATLREQNVARRLAFAGASIATQALAVMAGGALRANKLKDMLLSPSTVPPPGDATAALVAQAATSAVALGAATANASAANAAPSPYGLGAPRRSFFASANGLLPQPQPLPEQQPQTRRGSFNGGSIVTPGGSSLARDIAALFQESLDAQAAAAAALQPLIAAIEDDIAPEVASQVGTVSGGTALRDQAAAVQRGFVRVRERLLLLPGRNDQPWAVAYAAEVSEARRKAREAMEDSSADAACQTEMVVNKNLTGAGAAAAALAAAARYRSAKAAREAPISAARGGSAGMRRVGAKAPASASSSRPGTAAPATPAAPALAVTPPRVVASVLDRGAATPPRDAGIRLEASTLEGTGTFEDDSAGDGDGSDDNSNGGEVVVTLPPVMRQLVRAVSETSLALLSAVFGMKVHDPARDAAQSSAAAAAPYPTSLTIDDEDALAAHADEAAALLEVAAQWRRAVPALRAPRSAAFVDVVRRSLPLRLRPFGFDGAALAEATDNATATDVFIQSLRGIVRDDPQEAQRIAALLGAMEAADRQRSQHNWTGLVRLQKLVRLKGLIQAALQRPTEEIGTVLACFQRDVVDPQLERWRHAGGVLRLGKEALWSSLIEALRAQHAAVRASGLDVDVLDGVGPSTAALLLQSARKLADEATEKQRRLLSAATTHSFPFDPQWYAIRPTQLGLARRHQPTHAQGRSSSVASAKYGLSAAATLISPEPLPATVVIDHAMNWPLVQQQTGQRPHSPPRPRPQSPQVVTSPNARVPSPTQRRGA